VEAAIKTENLVKIYRGKGKSWARPVYALKELNLDIGEGGIFGFIGPNGAGKTTTIKILMGLISPTSGSATIMGHPAGSVEAKKQVGFLSEVAYYYPFMEVGKLLDFYCSFYEIPPSRRREQIEKVLGLVSLSDKINARMSDLSKGMAQRFGIAQAIIANPPILILDELTSGLDPIAQKEVKDIVLSLKNQGKTIFFSSHQMTEVENICDRIGIIHKGVMKKCAGLDEFLKEESGGLSKIIFEAAGELLNELKGRAPDVEQVRLGVYSLILPEADVAQLNDSIRQKGARVIEISSYRYSLEDAFFKLIKEDEEE
jgi:ABC-2 type transport system ATP-binding protein